MNTTAKAVTFVVAFCAMIGIVSTSLTQAGPSGGGSPPGFCDNIVDCIVDDPFVQDAIEFATHDRYTDEEAVAAMDPLADDNPLNHERYTDEEARDAVGPVGGITGYEIVRVVISGTAGFGSEIPIELDCPPPGDCLAGCPDGKILLGGGARVIFPVSGLLPLVVSADEGNAWRAIWVSNIINPFAYEVEVFAICADESPGVAVRNQ